MADDVRMVREDMEGIPAFPLPDGFSMRGMKPGDEAVWTEVWQDVEPPGKIDSSTFAREFGADWRLIGERCLLLAAPGGELAGTVSAWFDDAFMGRPFGRIHWVAIKRAFQGKGLAKPMLAAALARLAGLGHGRCYLVTQTHRLPAIKLYLQFGFKPLINDEADRAKWSSVGDCALPSR